MTSAPIEVTLNGEARPIPAGTDVAGLVAALGLGPAGVAVEVNRQIVPRAQWATVLAPGDQVEVVAFVGGG